MHNITEFNSYLEFKKTKLGCEFLAKIQYLCDKAKNYWIPLDSAK